MRGRILTAGIVLCLIVAAVWEGRKWLSSPVVTTVAPPAVLPVMPPAPKKPLPQIPKKAAAQKNPAAPVTPAPPAVIRPPLLVVPSVPLPREAPPPQEWRGNSDTSIKHSGQIVVQNDHQWIRFWAEHHPDEAAPEVDFSQSMVVGVFVGRRPADAFRIDITGVRTLPDALVVEYIERAPPPGTFQVAVEAYPYDIKVIPRSAQHVKFNKLKAQYQPSPYQRPEASSAAAPGSK